MKQNIQISELALKVNLNYSNQDRDLNPKSFFIQGIREGRNSSLFRFGENFILYEKLANTIHSGDKIPLQILQEKAESIDYNPLFEADSLRSMNGRKLESLLLNVTEICNLACSYCIYSGKYESERRERNSDMSFETARKAIDIFMPLSKERVLIGFYGGEPLNNMSLIKAIIRYIKNTHTEKNPVFSMTSNFCDADKHLREIVQNEIYINISLDGPKQIHDLNRRFKDGRPTFDRIMKNLRRLEAISPDYAKSHISQSATYTNPHDLPEIIRFFNENCQLNVARISGVESKGLTTGIRNGGYLTFFKLASDYLTSILSKRNPGPLKLFFDQELKRITSRSLEFMPTKLMLNGCCYPGNRKLFVDTEGKFYMCEKVGQRIPIGDVEKGIDSGSIDQAIDRFTQIRNNHCTNQCWATRLCDVCIQSSKEPEADISQEGLAQTCNSNKFNILIAIANYVFLSKKNKQTLEEYIDSI